MGTRLKDYYEKLVTKVLKEASSRVTSLKELCLKIEMLERTIKALPAKDLSSEDKQELLDYLAEARVIAGCKQR